MAILYGVSVGPGEPELMTLKAINTIKNSAILVAPTTKDENNTMALDIVSKVINIEDKKIIYTKFPMSKDEKILKENYERIADEMSAYLNVGKNIAFLNIGDISIYSTFSYISDILIDKGYNIEIIPGVTSFCAMAAKLKTSIVQGNESVVIIPGSSEKFDDLVKIDTNKIIMKGYKSVNEIKKIGENINIMAVENCGLENEKIYRTADEIDDNCGYFTTFFLKRLM